MSNFNVKESFSLANHIAKKYYKKPKHRAKLFASIFSKK